ncbi:hypothetical protein WA026_023215 [Henosepilachna vigintioctopunctata]|uniref:Uncharacterized protein n=1 Tax=Henosepilachna vigintioctopunctata TaxID=420089 RepID=A0AAW1VH58_9CUCU
MVEESFSVETVRKSTNISLPYIAMYNLSVISHRDSHVPLLDVSIKPNKKAALRVTFLPNICSERICT